MEPRPPLEPKLVGVEEPLLWLLACDSEPTTVPDYPCQEGKVWVGLTHDTNGYHLHLPQSPAELYECCHRLWFRVPRDTLATCVSVTSAPVTGTAQDP